MEEFNLNGLNSLSREHYYNIWQRVKAGEKLEGEEKIIGDLMWQHEEYYNEWDSTDFERDFDPETDVNPFVHIMIDSIVITQISKNDPPQTRFTYNLLIAKGHSHLEAIHKIDSVVVEEIWALMKEGREFNEKQYIAKLKRLSKH